MDIRFRIANYGDIEGIINLCNECFNENTSLEYAQKMFLKTMNDENQIYLIAEYDGEIIAHTKITIIPTIYEEMNTYAILNHVCVKPSARRHKLGTKMLEECEKICKEKNCVCIELWSMNFREAAHACYQRFGFTKEECGFFSKKIK